ncbi:DUF6463 family protein [Massilia sp. CCM 8734]|uniref:DUF6463 family protein n=1 Tax=Massilia sp. CCM 8734 TaxID=2609283 RepID=UPI001423A8F7|nr:DUF6463 family protein [Massilia sp. CCM 8734]NIA00446.1 hypothetical protein [Massilia sp. CCM 8734]
MTISSGHIAAATLFVLGILHILFGVAKFRQALGAAWGEGLFNRFGANDERRLAFWFIAFGPPLVLCGHLAWRAAGAADTASLGLVGIYGFATGAVGIVAFPRSPLWGLVAVSAVLIAIGEGWIV